MPAAVKAALALALLVLSCLYARLPGTTTTTTSDGAFRDVDDTVPRDTPALFAIADIHGDYPRALSALHHAGVVDSDGSWIAGAATLVQTGDIVDRGPDTRRLYAWMRNLTDQAAGHGGRVVKLWGNHEYMNAMFDWRYVDAADWQYRDAQRRKAFSAGGEVVEDWMRDYAVTYRDPVFRAHFMHAGLDEAHAQDANDVVGRAFMTHLTHGKREHTHWTEAEARFWEPEGPMWYRGYATLPEQQACAVARSVMATLDADFLVMGHTPHFEGALTRCHGRVLLIDTGLSAAYGGRPVVLQFSRSSAGTREVKLWYDDDQSVETVYPPKQGETAATTTTTTIE